MVIKGIGASDGYAMSKIYKYEVVKPVVSKSQISDVEAELKKVAKAIDKSKAELTDIMEKTRINIDEEHAAIFGAHIEIITDPELISSVEGKIQDEKVNADYAFKEVTDTFISMFEAMEEDYFRERAADIKDVSQRVLCHIQGLEISDPSSIDEEVIILAEDLTPSDTAGLNKKYVKGFITNIGGRTSHSAIMSRTLEIPAIVGTKTAFEDIANGTFVIIDGFTGEVMVDPDEALKEKYRKKQAHYLEEKEIWKKFVNKKSLTSDNFAIEMAANIGSPDDVEGALANGAEGVGLYRTEFLYMGQTSFPTEDEQFEAYKKVLEGMGDRPVVVRTLDIGGDKELSYFDMPHELNPFLGNRAIRLCMNNKEIFKTQIRALLRAGVYGNLKIMFPMIATIDEFLEAKDFLMKTREELQAEGVKVAEDFELGIMVEIPATAVLARQFAKVVDFFSIGTNDLIQYTFAADRMNEKVSYLYQPYNPALLNLIKNVIDAAHAEGKWVGMCGEMAGETRALPLLLGMGLDEFSMSATSILKNRHMLSKISKKSATDLANKALEMSVESEVKRLVEEFFEANA